MENLNGTLKLSGNLTGEEIPVIIKEKTVVEKNYENLDNKPSINDVILEGNKTPAELGLTKASDFELYKQSVDRSFRGVSESIRSVKTESKTYTDNAIEAAKAYSDGKNSDLETTINETINNKDNGTRAYASHLVVEESDARETADEETLAASKSYTDTEVVKVRGYTDTEITKCKEYTDEKIAEVSDRSSYSPCIYKLLENGSEVELSGLQEGINFSEIIIRDCYNAGYVREDAVEETIAGMKFIPDKAKNKININSNYGVSTEEIVYTLTGEMILFAGTTYRIGMNQVTGGGQLELVDENDNIVYNSGGTIASGTYTVTNTGKYRLRLRLYKGFSRETNAYIEVSHNTDFHTSNDYAVGKEISFSINEDDYKITPDTPNYSVPLDILQRSGINTAKMFMSTKYAEVIIVGSTINPAIKRLSNDFNVKIGNINTILEEGGDITAKGNPVQLDGLQGGVPFSEIAVSGKNLTGIAQAKALIGDSTSGYSVINNATSRTIIQKLQPNTTYHIKRYDSGNRFRIVMFDNEPANAADITAKQLINNADGSISDYTLSTGEDHLWIALTTNFATSGEAIEPIVQLEYGDTATEYEPPITGRELTVNVSGKNLLKNKLSTITSNGITATINDDGSVTINRTASSELNSYLVLWNNIPARYVANQKIAINAINGQSLATCYMGVDRLENGTYIDRIAVGLINNGVGMVTQEDVDNDRVFRTWIFINKDYAPNNLIVYPQLELGDTATAYEPYHGSTTTITPDSNPYTVPNDIRQQDGLNNISVSAGTLSVTGVRKNAALKRVWNEMNDFNAKIGNINTVLESVTGGAE